MRCPNVQRATRNIGPTIGRCVPVPGTATQQTCGLALRLRALDVSGLERGIITNGKAIAIWKARHPCETGVPLACPSKSFGAFAHTANLRQNVVAVGAAALGEEHSSCRATLVASRDLSLLHMLSSSFCASSWS